MKLTLVIQHWLMRCKRHGTVQRMYEEPLSRIWRRNGFFGIKGPSYQMKFLTLEYTDANLLAEVSNCRPQWRMCNANAEDFITGERLMWKRREQIITEERTVNLPPPPAQQPTSGPESPQYRGFTTTLWRTPLDDDQPDVAVSTWQLATFTREIHAPVRFEPVIPASERQQTHTLDGAAVKIRINLTTQYFCCYNFIPLS
jgi:hypothetical protein